VKLTAEGKARVREAAKAWARAQADAAEIVSGDAMAAIVEATARLK
jgi:hypothetical protein